MNPNKALWKASGVFAPGFPRKSSDGVTYQSDRYNRASFCEALEEARDTEMPGYYSVYSFPNGHSKRQNIPKVDCIFIDLDIEGKEYEPKTGKSSFEAWRREMSALLARARMIADAILEMGREDNFRVALSGHKGLHLYLDFPAISTGNGDFQQFKIGLKQYGTEVMNWLDSTAGGVDIDQWVDVDASDLGRLARHPNTVHHNAAYDDTIRWCVPITVEELSGLTVDDYMKLTRKPRWIDGYERNPSKSAGDKVVQSIRNASKSRSRNRSTSSVNSKLVKYYDRELDDKWYGDTSDLTESEKSIISDIDPENNDIEHDDIEFLTKNKPCIKAFSERDDAFQYNNASHLMEMSVLARLVDMSVPRDVIHDFLSGIPGYRKETTDEQINKVISRSYQEFDCSKIASQAGTFCLGSDCSIYNRSDDVQK